MGFFKEFSGQKKFVRSLNTSTVLTPKKRNVEEKKDLRSISLQGSLCKILAKALANILRRVMGIASFSKCLCRRKANFRCILNC